MTAEEKPPVVIYTDGACKGNPGPGGWGAYMHNGKRALPLSGGEPETTNQRMELMAAVQALEFFKTPRELTIYSDSKYLIRGMTEWLPNWVAKGWKKSKGGAVENRDLWERLRAAAALHEVTWLWVKGHAGHEGNERADALATSQATKAQARLTTS